MMCICQVRLAPAKSAQIYAAISVLSKCTKPNSNSTTVQYR